MNKYIRLALIIYISVFFAPFYLYATAYSIPSSLINIPVVKDHKKGDLTYGTYLGFFDKNANEFDAKLTYTPFDNLL